MRGLFHRHREETVNPRLVATVTKMSEREQSALSKWLHVRYCNNAKVYRKMPCFVFDDHISETHNCWDFTLTLSNGTAFIDTRADLVAGQRVTVLFPACNNQGPIEIIGEVVWLNRKADDT
jgi:hypothetical protein